MTTTRKQYTPKFKAKEALEAIRGERRLNQLASQFHVHPVQDRRLAQSGYGAVGRAVRGWPEAEAARW